MTKLVKFKFTEHIVTIKDNTRGKSKLNTPKQDIKDLSVNKIAKSNLRPHRSFLPFLKDYERLYNAINNNIYSKNMSQIINDKISYLEKEIANMSDKVSDKRVNLIYMNIKEVTPPKTLFNLTSIKETENHLKTLPAKLLKDMSFQMELLNHYSNLNIDKAFEYYYETFYKLPIETNEYFVNFIRKCFQYDKSEYVCII
jgi:hypothetical protein